MAALHFPPWPLLSPSRRVTAAVAVVAVPATTPAGLRSLHLAFSYPIHHTPFHLTCPISSAQPSEPQPSRGRLFRLAHSILWSSARPAIVSTTYCPPRSVFLPSALLRRRLIANVLDVGVTDTPSATPNTFSDPRHNGNLSSYPRPGRQVL
jgi:hypothetical protein